VVGETSHYAAVDENEDVFDGDNYVWTDEEDKVDIFDFETIDGNRYVDTVRAGVCIMTETGKLNEDKINLYLTTAWQGEKRMVPDGEDTGDAWKWFYFDWSIEDTVDLSNTFVLLRGVAPNWLRVGALYIQLKPWHSRIRIDDNPFGQHFRTFDHAVQNDVSFERRDRASGPWSTPTQPFSGDGNHSPDIECLPTGALRAACIDSDGNLQRMVSLDDGESWGAA